MELHHLTPTVNLFLREPLVPVLRDDSVDDLKARVRAREKEFVVETLAGIAKGDIRLAAGPAKPRLNFG
jgi:folate-dependent phosphoribosylglycinamide formyltransferase PurN